MRLAAAPAARVTTPVDFARLHSLLRPAQPTERIFIVMPEAELSALQQEMKTSLTSTMFDDLHNLSNLWRDEDVTRAAILTWWYAGADWDAYRQDARWSTSPMAWLAAPWELHRIFAALAPAGRAFLEEPATVSPDIKRAWLIKLDHIDVAGYLRIRLGHEGYSLHAEADRKSEVAA